MLVQTIERLTGLVPPERTLVITNAEQAPAVAEVCPMLPPENIIAEPVGRDTAAAVGLAQVLVRARDPEGTMAMLPADAAIADHEGFRRGLRAAFAAAETEPVIVTIGISPTYPATGYGYIEAGELWQSFDDMEAHRVKQFREKPDEATAQAYLNAGGFAWNAGMFIFKATTIAACFEQYTPALNAALESITAALKNGEDVEQVLAVQYPGLEKISVDYAIMEPASADQRIVTLPAPFDWDDVGEWPAVARHRPADEAGNVIHGTGWVKDGQGNLVVTEGDHRIALLGCEDLVVVQTEKATLVCPKAKAQDIKKLVKELAMQEGWSDLM